MLCPDSEVLRTKGIAWVNHITELNRGISKVLDEIFLPRNDITLAGE